MKDSSEIREAAKLFDELISQSAVPRIFSPLGTTKRRRVVSGPADLRKKAKHKPVHDKIEISDTTGMYRGDRLENTLFAMCKRGGFSGAMLVDSNGLPLAVYNNPADDESIGAAIAMTLGGALEKIGRLLNYSEINNISIDINYTDKSVIHRFMLEDLSYFLMVVCSQEIDERAEVELSIDNIISVLKDKAT